MKIANTTLRKEAYFLDATEDVHILKDPNCVDLFDQNGYHLTKAEQAFLVANVAHKLFNLPLWSSIGLYSLAVTSSFLRVAADRHFISDTIMGGGIAYLGTWIAYQIWEDNTSESPTKKRYR